MRKKHEEERRSLEEKLRAETCREETEKTRREETEMAMQLKLKEMEMGMRARESQAI